MRVVSRNQQHLPTSVGEMRLSRPADWLDTPLAVDAPDAMATCDKPVGILVLQ